MEGFGSVIHRRYHHENVTVSHLCADGEHQRFRQRVVFPRDHRYRTF